MTANERNAVCARALAEIDSALGRGPDPGGRDAERLPQLTQLVAEECLSTEVDPQLRARASLVAARETGAPFEKRRELLLRAKEFLELEAPRTPERIRVLQELSGVAIHFEDLAESRRLIEEGLELRRAFYGNTSPEAVDGMILLGFQYFVESEFEKEGENLERAQTVFEEALEHAKASLGPRAPATVRAWSALAGALRRRGQVEEADRIVEEHVEPFPAESLDAELGPIPEGGGAQLFLQVTGALGLEGEVWLERLDRGRLEVVESTAVAGVEEGSLQLRAAVPCEAETLFRARAPGLVSLVFALPPAACDEGARPALEVPLLAAGRVVARFLPPPGGKRPAGGWWGVRDCAVPGRAPAFAFELPLAIDTEGLAEALVPAGCLDLRARFPGFAPEVEPGAKVAPGGRLELAARRLRPAVSIALQVVDTGGRAPVRGAAVLLVGAEQVDATLRRLVAGERPRAMARGETGEDGRLVFEDLAAGAYAAVVAPRSAALAPVARAVPELAPGARHDLGRLRERLAATLIVATEVGEASGAAELLVDLTLAGDDALLEGPWRQVQLLPGGSVEVEGLPPGSWLVQLLALDRNGHLEPGGARTVELAEGETRVLPFAVPMVTETLLFHGRIVDDAEPEEGASEEEESLAFDLGVSWPEVEGRRGGTNFTPSAPDGSFTIRLPGPGTYLVEWFDPRRGQSTVVPEVRFEDPDEEVIVRPPRGRIEGRVVDEEGKPVREGFVGALAVTCEPGAECEFERPYPGISASIREDGSFALTRVAGGSYRITARAEKGEVESESQVVQLPEDGRLAGVVLVLRRSRPLDLAFVSPEGLPLVAIGGQVLALRADGEVDGHRFVTDARGNATVRLRGGARGRALVLLDAPGRAIAGFRVDTGRAGRHRLALPPTGSLVLRTGPRDQRTADEGLGGAAQLTGPLFLVGAEATLPLGGLVNVLQTGLPEGRLRLDGLAAGPWVLVRTPPELWLPALRGIVRGEPLPGAPLASFQLEPGGEVVLDLGATEPPAAP